MICPICGKIDNKIPSPEFTRKGIKNNLGDCSNCQNSIWAIPTAKYSEHNQQETVDRGEKREVVLSSIFLRYSGGDSHHKTDKIDIDRYILKDGKKRCYFEIYNF